MLFVQMIGVGTLVMMPLLGNFSDKYGRKAILKVPMILTIIPTGIFMFNGSSNIHPGQYTEDKSLSI